MKNKAFLSIIEQLLMILFFALAAALALKGFALAENMTQERQILESATFAAENTAETLKSCKGDFAYAAQKLSAQRDEGSLVVMFNHLGDLLPPDSSDEDGFLLVAEQIPTENPLLGSAKITAYYQNNVIYTLTVCWQEDVN